ncbi:uncharacterized protein LOC117112691 [Anneissia japonica]|uniref:uncharacterized protein LOC117112691 n=1 Tax=Anneissia japonica TaxID=1529436 RepID=UPI0014259FA7|nr:uncharacterized protein LOC117112691 [Anneissia japonica]
MYRNDLVKNTKPGKQLKQSFFMNLQGLSDEDRLTVLTSVTDGNRTIKEAEQDARNTKLLKEIKRKFLKTTKVLTWEEAEVRFPQHTTEAALREFITTRKTKCRQAC